MTEDAAGTTRSVEVPRIAVIGMACRFPGADDVGAFWSNLVDGVDSISRFGAVRSDRFVPAVGRLSGIEDFAAEHFRISAVEATAMDPQARVLLEVAAAALDDAGYRVTTDEVVGVFAGSGENTYLREHLAPNAEFCENLGEMRLALTNEKDFLAPRIAFKLGLTGPSITVQASCATGLTAVALACQALASGDCDIAVAGGVSLLMPSVDGYVYAEGGVNSADGYCRAFDSGATGTVPSSGVGAVVLKRDDAARADRDNCYAVIRGWAINNDGAARAGFTVPSVVGQERVIRTALRRAGVRPRQVGYVEAHGTGTPLGDPIEIEALRRVFADDDCAPESCAVGSVKTNIGHTDAAAGIAGLIKAVLTVRTGTIPASLHFDSPNPAIDFAGSPFFVSSGTRPWPGTTGARLAGVSSFGLGGTNAHVVLSDPAPVVSSPSPRARQVLTLSAHTDAELRAARDLLAARLAAAPADELADVAFTSAVTRPVLAHRWAAAVATPADAARELSAGAPPGPPAGPPSLAVQGDPATLARSGARDAEAEPLLRDALAGLAERHDVEADQLASVGARGALALIAFVRSLTAVGIRPEQVALPRWAAPAQSWLRGGTPDGELSRVLAACADEVDRAGTTPEGAAPATVTVGPELDVSDTLARLWAAGADVDWRRFYAGEQRRRVSLPAYPLTRRRHWLDRPEPVPAADGTAESTAGSRGVAELVEATWRDVLGLSEAQRDIDFLDLGGDSIAAVEIGARLNEALGLDLPLDLAFEASTIDDMTTYIEKRQGIGAGT